MNHVRLHGDPFGGDAGALRSLLRSLQEAGMRVSLSLVVGPERAPEVGERRVAVDIRGRRREFWTRLPERQVDWLCEAIREDVVATAPLVVFAGAGDVDDQVTMCGLAWPKACVVIAAGRGSEPTRLTERVRAELRWSGNERQPHARPEMELRPWLSLEPVTSSCVLHVTDDVFACGTDLVIASFARDFVGQGLRLKLVASATTRPSINVMLREIGPVAAQVDVVDERFAPRHARDAAAIVQPYRRLDGSETLVRALASARPVVCACFDATALVLPRDASALYVLGRHAQREGAAETWFEPDPASLRDAWGAALDASEAATAGARSHVVGELLKGRPVASPPPLRQLGDARPKVVLEAPVFAADAAAEAAITTARAMVERGHVDVHIAPTGAFDRGIEWLRQRAPELVSRVRRNPGRADLWLSAGWPLRADRPDCGVWVMKPSIEVEAATAPIGPHVVEEADHVLVDSQAARNALCAAGRAGASVSVAPYDAAASLEALALGEHAPVGAPASPAARARGLRAQPARA